MSLHDIDKRLMREAGEPEFMSDEYRKKMDAVAQAFLTYTDKRLTADEVRVLALMLDNLDHWRSIYMARLLYGAGKAI